MDSNEQIVRLLKHRKAVDMQTLREALGGRSRRSMFRDLGRVGYRSSYTHAGRYYTLMSIPEFDEQGLWFCRDIGFSRAGTLKQTAVVQVQQSSEGRTHDELRNLLRVRVHNTLLDLLRGGRIGRETLAGQYLYVSADPQRAAEQISKRQKLALRVLTDEEIVKVLVEALRAAPQVPAPDEVARRLAARQVHLGPRVVEQVYEQHQLVVEKKRHVPTCGARDVEGPAGRGTEALPGPDALSWVREAERRRGCGPMPDLQRPDDGAEVGAFGRTLAHGPFAARETVHACDAVQPPNLYLAETIKPYRMPAVGCFDCKKSSPRALPGRRVW